FGRFKKGIKYFTTNKSTVISFHLSESVDNKKPILNRVKEHRDLDALLWLFIVLFSLLQHSLLLNSRLDF
ncbi:hypothetical protein V7146_01555, partial [Gottfriedia acidiceleris]|uniref:hypothetical protein n=1 Tax=Gottfriedia acidiceleris TaxID=371036 RepID=UPI0030008681